MKIVPKNQYGKLYGQKYLTNDTTIKNIGEWFL